MKSVAKALRLLAGLLLSAAATTAGVLALSFVVYAIGLRFGVDVTKAGTTANKIATPALQWGSILLGCVCGIVGMDRLYNWVEGECSFRCSWLGHAWLFDLVTPPPLAPIAGAFAGFFQPSPHFTATCYRCGRHETHGEAFERLVLEGGESAPLAKVYAQKVAPEFFQ